jgi:hypothetical protein
VVKQNSHTSHFNAQTLGLHPAVNRFSATVSFLR